MEEAEAEALALVLAKDTPTTPLYHWPFEFCRPFRLLSFIFTQRFSI